MAMRRRFMQDSRIDVNRYLTFVARENNTSVSLVNTNLNTYGFSDIQYSINGEHLIKGNVDNIIINSGETLSVKATYHAPLFMTSTVVISKPVDVIGTISSIFASANDYRCIFCRTSIVDASLLSLPATTLTDECYSYMFYGCSSLTTAPALPATTLASYCYYYMFTGCEKLNYIKMLATDISASGCLSDWVYGVASTGTFVKNPNMTSLPTGDSGIPSGWTVINDGEDSDKVVNKVQLVNDGLEWDFMFDYPVNSNLQVNFADGLVYVAKGIQQSSTGYPSFNKPTIVGIDPLEDDKYIYTW